MNNEMKNKEKKQMLERIIGIHQQILSGNKPNSSQLAEMFNVSISTISRDIEFLRTCINAPIEYDSHKRGYFYSTGYAIPINLFTCK